MTVTAPITTPEAIAAAIARAGQLATLPEIALEVMRVAEDPQATGDDLIRVLSHDPTLSARVLKIVNSAYYGVRREVTSIGTAVALLGFGAVKSIAIAASLTRMFRAGAVSGGFEARELWKHSIAVATAARLLAQRVAGVEPSDAFLGGMMHDIGIVIELQACRDAFSDTIAAVGSDPTLSFIDTEKQYIGVSHEQFGAALCVAWRFPELLQRVTGHHHRPLELSSGFCPVTGIVYVADHLAAQLGLGYSRTVDAGGIDPAILEALGIDAAELDALAELVETQFAEVFPLLTGEG